MNKTAFIAVGSPVLVLSITSLALTSFVFLRLLPNPFSHYLRLAVLVQVMLIFLQIFWLVLRISANHGKQRHLPESPPSSVYQKVLKPIGGEGIRLLLIAVSTTFLSQGDTFDIFHAYCIATVYAINFSVAYCLSFSPFHYADRYARFLHQHTIYESSKSINKAPVIRKVSLDHKEIHHLHGLIDESPEKPVFNLNFFAPAQNLKHHKLMPILIQNSQQAHLDMIDRLYAISPKNTIHLQLEAGYNEQTIPMDKFYPTEYSPAILEPGQEDDSPQMIQATLSDDTYSEETLLSSSPENFSLLSSSSSGVSEKSSLERFKDLVVWFRWILPIHGASDKESIPTTSPYEIRRSLNKKLSSYTLNSETISLKAPQNRTLYGTIDLEGNTPSESECKNVHEYYRFASFSNKYFDSNPSTSTIDPSFITFGELLTSLPLTYFILYGLSNILRHFAYTLALSPIFMAPNICGLEVFLIGLMLIVKLFSHNYLYQQSTSSYKQSIVVDFCIMLALFCINLSSCYCILS